LELPSQVILDEQASTPTYGRFIIEPFERGFGITVGKSLRRVLLSSLKGAAVATVKIGGAAHEFTTLKGVLEDVTDIILNVKGLVVGMESDEIKTMSVTRDKKGEVRAADIVADPAIRIVNPNLVLATLTDDVRFQLDMTVRTGRGYATAEENQGPEQEIGVIPVDSVFSPVERVRYKTEETRVGQRTNYDRLVLEVWTKGTILPEDALVEAAKILRKHLNPFVQYHDLGDDVVTETPEPVHAAPVTADHLDRVRASLDRPVSDLELSVRASNCMGAARIHTLGVLVAKSEAELLRVRSFGKTSLREVKKKLADLGLSLGMNFNEGGDVISGMLPSETEDEMDRVPEQVGN
jgi:DNA-directed RNA polymerase subunit alpha